MAGEKSHRFPEYPYGAPAPQKIQKGKLMAKMVAKKKKTYKKMWVSRKDPRSRKKVTYTSLKKVIESIYRHQEKNWRAYDGGVRVTSEGIKFVVYYIK